MRGLDKVKVLNYFTKKLFYLQFFIIEFLINEEEDVR